MSEIILNVNLVLSPSTTSNVSLLCLISCSSITGLSPPIVVLRCRVLLLFVLCLRFAGFLICVVTLLLCVARSELRAARLLLSVAKLLALCVARLPLDMIMFVGVKSTRLSGGSGVLRDNTAPPRGSEEMLL